VVFRGAQMATLDELTTRLAALEAAYDRIVSRGVESYTMPDGRVYTALKLPVLRAEILEVQRLIGSNTPGGRRNYSARRGAC